jgi:GT2 family glycosyltransferase
MSTQHSDLGVVTITCGDSEASAVGGPRLHVSVLDYIPDAGIVAAGWLSDMPRSITAITVERGAGRAVDLLRDATVPLTPPLCAALGIAPQVGARLGFVLFLPSGPSKWDGGLRLEVRHARGAVEHAFALATGHFSELGRMIDVAPLDQALRLTQLLLAGCGGAVTEGLPSVIEAWMVRLHQRIGKQRRTAGGIDEAVRVGTSGILLRGCLPVGIAQRETRIVLVSFSGRRVLIETLLTAAVNGENAGFAAFAAVPELGCEERHWFVEIIGVDGRTERIPFVCPTTPPPFRGIEAALTLLEPLPHDPERVLEHAVAPAVDWFWLAACQGLQVKTSACYGHAAGAVQVSVLVSLNGSIEHARHQIAQFSNDPEFRSGSMAELIYVVDDVSVTEELRRLSESLFSIYDVPFRTLVLDRRCGSAGAGNAGASAASGSILLFLGPEVLPDRPGWVGRLVRRYHQLDRCGVLGCRLLFEDGSIRHGGITFRAATSPPGQWEDHDPAIGLPSSFGCSPAPARVPAVTGACLMIDRALFRQLGGLSEEYVFGGFADYDLCLAAQQHGRHVYCTPEVELYQPASDPPAGAEQWQERLTRYNRWKLSRKWHGLIPTVLAAAEA